MKDGFLYIYFFFFNWSTVGYNVALVSVAVQCESAKCVFISPSLGPPSHPIPHPTPLGHHRSLS